jgi:hypothetical protein
VRVYYFPLVCFETLFLAFLPLSFSLVSALPWQIAYHNSKLEEVSQHSVRIAKSATIGQLLEELRRQLPAEAQGERPLRLLEVYQWRIWQVGAVGRQRGWQQGWQQGRWAGRSRAHGRARHGRAGGLTGAQGTSQGSQDDGVAGQQRAWSCPARLFAARCPDPPLPLPPPLPPLPADV